MNSNISEETLEIIKHLTGYFLRRDGWEPEVIYNKEDAIIEIRLMDMKYYRVGRGE